MNPKLNIQAYNQSYTNQLYSHRKYLMLKQQKKIKQDYHFPSQISIAQHHQINTRFIYNRIKQLPDEDIKCQCCQLPIHIHQIQICSDLVHLPQTLSDNKNDPKTFSHLNISILFHFFKMVIMYLFFRIVIFQIIKIFLFINSKYCLKISNNCSGLNLISLIVLPQIRFSSQQLLQTQSFINFLSLIFCTLYLVSYRIIVYKYFLFLQSLDSSEADYTIFVENISFISLIQAQYSKKNNQLISGKQRSSQKKNVDFIDLQLIPKASNSQSYIKLSLQMFFNNLIQKLNTRILKKAAQNINSLSLYQLQIFKIIKDPNQKSLKMKPVKHINLCYNLSQLERLQLLRDQSLILRIQNSQYLDQKSYNFPPNRVHFLSQKIFQMQANFSKCTVPQIFLSRFIGSGFVSFECSQYKNYLLNVHKNNLRVFYDDNIFLSLSEPQYPQSIIWENLKYPFKDKLKSQLISFTTILFSVLILILLFILAVQFLTNFSNHIKQQQKMSSTFAKQKIIFWVLLSYLTIIFNYGISKLLSFLGSIQILSSKTDITISRLIKQNAFTFLFLVIAILASIDYLSISQNENTKIKYLLTIFCLIVFIRSLFNAVPFSIIFLFFQEKYYQSSQYIGKFQIQLNQNIKYKQFDVTQAYCFYVSSVFLASFFYTLTFTLYLILIFVLIFNYWIYKYHLLRYHSHPFHITKRICFWMVEIFQYDLIVFSIGNYFLLKNIQNSLPAIKDSQSALYTFFNFSLNQQTIAMIQIIFSIVFKIFLYIISSNFYSNSQNKAQTYSECENIFQYYYMNQNPATKFSLCQSLSTSKNEVKIKENLPENNNIIVDSKKANQKTQEIHQFTSIDISRSYHLKDQNKNDLVSISKRKRFIK